MSKIIHYCWFGDKKLDKLALKCIKSWKKFLPDYEIMLWNEKNFDVNSTPFSKKAYEEGKWAFVSDVARIHALREYGGIYFDTDMMITKDVSEIVNKEFFAGWETKHNVAVGVLGIIRGKTLGQVLPFYIISLLGLYVHFSLSAFVNLEENKKIIRMNMVDFLENKEPYFYCRTEEKEEKCIESVKEVFGEAEELELKEILREILA